jgi:hypothetical protein
VLDRFWSRRTTSIKAFLVARQSYPDAVCILGELRFDLAGRCIASDSAYDVATFRIEGDEIGKLAKYANGKAILTGSQKSWPSGPPQVGRGIFFVGFPGDGREMRPYLGNSLVEIDWLGYTAPGCGKRRQRHRHHAGV